MTTLACPDAATTWAAERDAWLESLIDAIGSITNTSVLRMCLQRLRENGGSVPGDLSDLIPSDRGEFVALARRVGIPRVQANTLAARWLGRSNPALAVATDADTLAATTLYRWFDADDLLLYIGISKRLRQRTADHIVGSSFMDFAVRSTIERFPTRAAVRAAEEAAIKAEHPLFNHQHNDTPEARECLVRYLIAHDRLDLLAPAVCRR